MWQEKAAGLHNKVKNCIHKAVEKYKKMLSKV